MLEVRSPPSKEGWTRRALTAPPTVTNSNAMRCRRHHEGDDQSPATALRPDLLRSVVIVFVPVVFVRLVVLVPVVLVPVVVRVVVRVIVPVVIRIVLGSVGCGCGCDGCRGRRCDGLDDDLGSRLVIRERLPPRLADRAQSCQRRLLDLAGLPGLLALTNARPSRPQARR